MTKTAMVPGTGTQSRPTTWIIEQKTGYGRWQAVACFPTKRLAQEEEARLVKNSDVFLYRVVEYRRVGT